MAKQRGRKRFQRPYDPAYSRYLLRRAGYTQRDLAEALNISPATVSGILNGKDMSRRFWQFFHELIQSAI